ncbi:MAG: amino acid--tRNA ligase-related protein, partial [Hyphomicrobium sp.]
FKGSGFKVFAGMIEKDPKVRVWAIPAPTGGSRAFCDRMNAWAQKEGQPGLGYIMFKDGKGQGPIANNIGPERVAAIGAQINAKDGDACFFAAGDPAKFYKFAGLARDQIGRELKLVDESRFALAWIVDFPFYEWNEEDKKIDFSHNPFSMPKGGREALEAAEKSGRDALLALKANQYDIVCNGYEIASGSVRNHVPETMVKAFEITGLSQADVEERFGGLYRAFQYGAPPHGGMAAGIERMVMLLTGCKAVRDVALFPMNQQAQDLLMGAPADVMPKQLRELSLRVMLPEAKKA